MDAYETMVHVARPYYSKHQDRSPTIHQALYSSKSCDLSFSGYSITDEKTAYFRVFFTQLFSFPTRTFPFPSLFFLSLSLEVWRWMNSIYLRELPLTSGAPLVVADSGALQTLMGLSFPQDDDTSQKEKEQMHQPATARISPPSREPPHNQAKCDINFRRPG